MGRAPLSPRSRAFQNVSTVRPRGVTAPRPVTTTRRAGSLGVCRLISGLRVGRRNGRTVDRVPRAGQEAGPAEPLFGYFSPHVPVRARNGTSPLIEHSTESM